MATIKELKAQVAAQTAEVNRLRAIAIEQSKIAAQAQANINSTAPNSNLTEIEKRTFGIDPAPAPMPVVTPAPRPSDISPNTGLTATEERIYGASAPIARPTGISPTSGMTTTEERIFGISDPKTTPTTKPATKPTATPVGTPAATPAAIPTAGLDTETRNLINSLQSQIASLTASQNTSAAATAAAAESARKDAMAVLSDRFAKYGLTSLATKIKELAITGASEATITLQLQETPEYQQRFSANALRLKKGLTVLSPAEYLANEDRYRQALRAYGLTQFDNDAYVSQFIANDVSPTELSNRIVTAVQRVQNADPAIAKQLKDYYKIGQTDLVAYVLDPEQQFQKIERQVAAAEIGVAAGKQGLTAGVNVAEQLAAQGVSQAEAQKGYATIADILPTAEKLSGIYGTTLEGYNQATAEQEVFNSLASAQRARQRLTARELAQFSGSSGMSKVSLSEGKTAGQI